MLSEVIVVSRVLIKLELIKYRNRRFDKKMVYTISKSIDLTNSDGKGSIWKQLLLSFLASIPFFSHGVQSNELTSSAHAGHFFATDDVSWSTTALVLGAAVSTPIYCYLSDKYGRKCGIYVVSLMQGASCIPLFLSGSEFNSIILHTFAGFSSGGLFTILPIYVREISTDSIRGFTVSLMMVMTTGGYMMRLVMQDEEMMYLLVALVAVQLLVMVVLIESPSYLVKVGRMEDARTNVCKLRSLMEDSPHLAKELTKLKEESDRVRSQGRVTLLRILKNPIYRDCMKTGFVLYTVMVLCGSIVFLDQDKTLMQLRLPSDPHKTLVVSALFAGSALSVVIIRVMDRKHLLTSAFTIMVISMGVLAVFTQADLTISTLRWGPVVSLGVLVFGYGLVWGLPAVVMVEMLNLELRATVLGTLFTYSQLLKLAHIHSWKYIEEYVGIYTLLYLFSAINMFGAVYSVFIIPNIKDKTVRQIERQLKRVPLLQFKTSSK